MKNKKPTIIVADDETGTFIICKPRPNAGAMLIFFLLFLALFSNGQTGIVKDAQGNYTAVHKERAKTAPIATKNTYTDNKGNVYPVFVSKNGKHYVQRVSKNTGKEYNFYLD